MNIEISFISLFIFFCLPKSIINMLLVLVSSYEDMYEIIVLFRNRKSYFDLKPHNIFLRCWFMTEIRQI